MHRFLPWFLVCSSLFAADPKPDSKQPRYTVKEVVPSTSPLSKKVIFIVDISGSMGQDDNLSRAFRFFTTTANAPVDAFDMQVFAMGSSCYHFSKDWVKMPDEEEVKKCLAWLKTFDGRQSTNAVDCFKEALRVKEKSISIVIISDGLFDNIESTAKTVLDEQTRRTKEYGRALIACFGVGENAEKSSSLIDLGRTWGGGFYAEVRVDEKKDLKK